MNRYHVPPIHRLVFTLALLITFLSVASLAQVLKGSISGSAVDPQGALVAGAQVKATNLATNTTLTTTTDSSGLFHFNLIPVGDYKVEVAAQGFRTAVQSNIVVAAGRDSGLGAIHLTVGEISAEVTVAEKLSDAHLNTLKDTLKSVTGGKAVDLNVKVDPTIIGGLVVKLGSRMVDSSLRTKLNAIKHAMKEAG